tara:strand:- start:280 stop:738 length:459 start_codon:yes stop_codon:yes gene_type:complete
MVDNIRLPKKIPAGVLKELVRERGQIFQSTSALERAGVEGATKRDVAAINKLIAEQRQAAEDRKTESRFVTSERDRPIRTVAASAAILAARTRAVSTGLTAFTIFKPLAVGIVIFFFIIGPGITSIFQIFQSFTWYYWVGAIFLILILLRSK